jgi:calcineurin-like phosphoesterase family protein
MAAATCTDAQFIALWKDLQSPSAIAKHLGVSMRTVQTRRYRIQERHSIILPVVSRGNNKTFDVKLVESSKAVIDLQITDGTVLVGSDAHIWPGELSTMQRAFVKFAKTLKPHTIIANGDFFDGARISRWPSIGWEQKPSVAQELEAVGDYMGLLEKASPASKRLWPCGNHDIRFESRIAAMAPEFERVKGVHLKDHFPFWAPCWRVDINDDVVVRHREAGGEHADWNNVVKGGKTIVTGHDHRTGVVPYRNYRGLHWGVRCGFMGDSPLDPQFIHYLEAKEPNWHPAFVVLTFKEGRLLWPELVTKHDDNSVEFRGEVVFV